MLHCTTIGGLLSALAKLDELQPQQRAVLGTLASRRGGIVSRDTIVDEMYADREDGGPLNTRDVIAVRTSQLRKLGFAIVTHHSRGLSYSPDWTVARRRRRTAA